MAIVRGVLVTYQCNQCAFEFKTRDTKALDMRVKLHFKKEHPGCNPKARDVYTDYAHVNSSKTLKSRVMVRKDV